MALSEKLSKLSAEKKKEQEGLLSPVRNKISEIEKEISELELISNSLDLKSNKEDGTGFGIKEAKAKLAEKIKAKGEELDKLFSKDADLETQKAMKLLGFKSKEDLLERAEFNDEKEVIDFKNTKNIEKELELSDKALKNKLESHGISISDGDLSYEDAEKQIKEKLSSLEGDLIKEKIKTPEGRETGINEIVSDFEKSSPKTALSFDEKAKGYLFDIGQSGYGRGISVLGDRAIFKKWYDPELISKNATDLESKYDTSMVKEAVKKTYENKLDKEFRDFDRHTEGVYLLKDELEKGSPAEGIKVKNQLTLFIDLQHDFRRALKEKSKEFKAQGIDFNPEYPPTYGGSYDSMIKLATDQQLEVLNRDLSDVTVFPPKYDYLKLQSHIEKKKKLLEDFIVAIQNLHTEADIQALDSGRGAGQQAQLSKLRLDLFTERFELYDFESKFVEKDRYSGNNISLQQKYLNELKFKAKNYDQAKEMIGQKIKAYENLKEIILNKIDLAVEAQFKRNELTKEMEKQNFGKDVGTLRSEIANIELQKSEAESLMIQLARFEAKYAGDEIALDENKITVTSISTKTKELDAEVKNKVQQAKNKKADILKFEEKKPKIFGKDTWNKKMEELLKEAEEIEKERQEKYKEYHQSLISESELIKTNYNTDVDRKIKEMKNLKGKPSEVFETLKSSANEIINRKVPESVASLYKQYSELEQELEK